eukprot:GSChrysophyteH1.ASY1.ANO1.1947.1 assembled CDS
MSLQRFKVGVKYIGTHLAGFTKSKDNALPSVQMLIEASLNMFLRADSWGEFKVSSRTDAGVHALRNVFTVDIKRVDASKSGFSNKAFVNGLNYYLKKQTSKYHNTGISVTSPKQCSDFDARRSASSRVYIYRLLVPSPAAYQRSLQLLSESANRAWCLAKPLDVPSMRAAADILRNDSKDTDYSTFRNALCQSKSPYRKVLRIEIDERSIDSDLFTGDASEIKITVEASSFLLRMVRNFVALLVHIGQGKAPPSLAAHLLKEKSRGSMKLKPAPASGLYLQDVLYSRGVAWTRFGEKGRSAANNDAL